MGGRWVSLLPSLHPLSQPRHPPNLSQSVKFCRFLGCEFTPSTPTPQRNGPNGSNGRIRRPAEKGQVQRKQSHLLFLCVGYLSVFVSPFLPLSLSSSPSPYPHSHPRPGPSVPVHTLGRKP